MILHHIPMGENGENKRKKGKCTYKYRRNHHYRFLIFVTFTGSHTPYNYVTVMSRYFSSFDEHVSSLTYLEFWFLRSTTHTHTHV